MIFLQYETFYHYNYIDFLTLLFIQTKGGKNQTRQESHHHVGGWNFYLSDAPIAGSAGAMSGYMTGIPQKSRAISIYPEPDPDQDSIHVDGLRYKMPAPTVYIPENGMFYIAEDILEYL